MKIKSMTLGVLITSLFFLSIIGTSALGYWKTTTEKVPVKFTEGEAAGAYNPEDIRGSYTFKEVSDLFDIELEVLAKAFNLPADADLETFKSKDLEGLYEGFPQEIGNGSLKLFVALYKNLPFALGDDYLLEPAVSLILENNNALTAEQMDYLKQHTLNTAGEKIVSEQTGIQSTEEASTSVEAGAATSGTNTETQSSTATAKSTENKASTATAPNATSNTASSKSATSNTSTAASSGTGTGTANGSGGGTGNGTGDGTGPGASVTGEEPVINGQSTFQVLLDLGITKAQIEEVIQGEMPPTNQSIRDYCQKNGLPFSEVKATFTALIE